MPGLAGAREALSAAELKTRIVRGPSRVTAHRLAEFEFAANAPDASFECSLNSDRFYPCGSPLRLYARIHLGEQYTLQVKARLGERVESTPASYSWRTLPALAWQPVITEPARGASVEERRLDVVGLASPGGRLRVLLDHRLAAVTQADAEGEWKVTISAEEGPHTLFAELEDGEGQAIAPTEPVEFTVRAAVPEGCSSGGGSPALLLLGLFIPYLLRDRARRRPLLLAPGKWRRISWLVAFLAWPAFATVAGGTSLPDTQLVGWPPFLTKDPEASFSFSSNEAGATFECSLDGGVFEACVSPWLRSGLGDGTHTMAVRARDSAGNTDPTPAQYSWDVDSTPPGVAVTVPALSTCFGGSVKAEGRSESGARVTVYVNEVPLGRVRARLDGGWSFSSEVTLANGTYSLRAAAEDSAGNVSALTPGVAFRVDSTEPETSFSYKPPPLATRGYASFRFMPAEPGTRFECNLDDQGFIGCEEDYVAPLNPVSGDHTLEVRARSECGVVDPTPAEYAWSVILEPPAPPAIAQPFEGELVDDTVLWVKGIAAPRGEVRVFLDGRLVAIAQVEEAGGWQALVEVAEGPHTLFAVVEDSAGNPSHQSAQVSFSVRLRATEQPGEEGCSSTGGSPALLLIGLVALAIMNSRRQCRQESRGTSVGCDCCR